MIEWLIIGGGIHGTYLSNLLTSETDVSPDDIRVLDPHDRPPWSCGIGMRTRAAWNISVRRQPTMSISTSFPSTASPNPLSAATPIILSPL